MSQVHFSKVCPRTQRLNINVLRSLVCNSNTKLSTTLPNYRAVGKVCRTCLPSNTAFRGFGASLAMIITEQWMQQVTEFRTSFRTGKSMIVILLLSR